MLFLEMGMEFKDKIIYLFIYLFSLYLQLTWNYLFTQKNLCIASAVITWS